MTGRPTTIDLGVLPPDGTVAPAERMSVRDWLRHRARRPVPWAPAALAVLLMLMVTAAAAPRPPWLVPHVTVPAGTLAGRLVIVDDTLYVTDRAPGGLAILTAYRLADGTMRWQASADEAYVWDGVPGLTWFAEDGTGARNAWLDPETGEAQLTRDGYLVAVTTDRLVFGLRDGAVQDPVLWWRTPDRFAIVDRRTDTELWDISAETWALPDPRSGSGSGLLLALDNARLSSYDIRTGRLVATTATAESTTPTPLPLQVVGSVVLLQPHEHDSTLVAYDLATLSRLWNEDLGAPVWQVAQCGRFLCIQDGASPVRAFDPASGEPVWTASWWALDLYSPPWLPDHFIVSDYADADWHRVVDAATGEPVLELVGWRPHDHDRDPELGLLLTRYEPNREPVVEQPGLNRERIVSQAAGQTWFARLHLDPPRLEVLGAADSGPSGCVSSPGYIACEDGGEVHVWRVR